MSITNEIVKFIAEIELDPKDKEAFTKALKESNDICAAFRREIAETEKELDKLTKAGKKDSEEFKKLNSQLELTKSKLQNSSKEANKYASILGINPYLGPCISKLLSTPVFSARFEVIAEQIPIRWTVQDSQIHHQF